MDQQPVQTSGPRLKDNQLVPLAIVVAGIFIAAAIYFGGSPKLAVAPSTNTTQGSTQTVGDIAPVTNQDYTIGATNPQLSVVEYSDYECPFCKQFHTTMHQVLTAYPNDVAWTYRQFPIVQLHSKAPKESEAALCVAELGGNAAFWKFTDAIFLTTNSNNSLDPTELPLLAASSGIDGNAFNACFASGRYTQKVTDEVDASMKAGALGTPYNVIIAKKDITLDQQKQIQTVFGSQAATVMFSIKDKKILSVNGAQPYTKMKKVFDILLK